MQVDRQSLHPALNAVENKTSVKFKVSKAILFPLLLLCLSLSTRWRALLCFFNADDFYCIENLHRIFHGEPQFLLQRLVSPWQNPHIQKLYRPLADLLFCANYSIWGSNAAGYHLTNLILHALVVLGLYFVCLEVFSQPDRKKEYAPAFIASCLFAVNPLLTEAVVWVVGCMDLLCGSLFILALYCFLRAKNAPNNRSWSLVALIAHVMAMLSKEVGVVLPAVLVATNLFLEGACTKAVKPSWLKLGAGTLPFFLATASFLVLRTCVLGTFPGGYLGDHGETLRETLSGRLMDTAMLSRIIHPLPLWLFPDESAVAVALHSLVCLAGLVLVARIPVLPWDARTVRLIAWAVSCFLLTILPSIQIYAVGCDLGGGRIFYLPSCFLAIALVLSLMPLVNTLSDRLIGVFRVAATTILSLIIAIYVVVSYNMLSAWETSGNVLRSLGKQITSCLATLPQNKKLLLLNLPSEYHGAYILFGFQELKTLVGPEFSSSDNRERIAGTDIYPTLSPVSSSRLNRLANDGGWDIRWYNAGLLTRMSMSKESDVLDAASVCVKRLAPASENESVYSVVVRSAGKPLNDAVLRLSVSLHGRSVAVMRSYSTCEQEYDADPKRNWSAILFADGVRRQYYAPLIDVADRPPDGRVDFLLKIHGRNPLLEIHSVEIVSSACIAKIKPDPNFMEETNDSTCKIRETAGPAVFQVDASTVPHAQSLLVEVSRPDVMFNLSRVRLVRHARADQPGYTAVLPGLRRNIQIFPKSLVRSGRYQIRVCALDQSGNIAGLFSDPVSFLVGCDE